jgi:hypothetical protein
MPRTIDEGFRDFHAQLTPTPDESEAAKNHRASIEACLKANFALKRFFRTGSFGNGTSISGYSDIDYFASIPREKLTQNSSTTLTTVRDVLDRRFPNTGVRTDCPAVRVPFGSLAKDATEVVPADYIETTSNSYLVYEIPDCASGWMHSSPDAHNAYVRRVDEKLKGKLKPLICFLKAWKYYRSVPISSFYLELRVTKYAEGESAIVYEIDVKNVFKHLHDLGLARMQDPLCISGYIAPCATPVKLEEAQFKVATALSRAQKARDATDRGDSKEAFDWWGLVFDGRFPSYYR